MQRAEGGDDLPVHGCRTTNKALVRYSCSECRAMCERRAHAGRRGGTGHGPTGALVWLEEGPGRVECMDVWLRYLRSYLPSYVPLRLADWLAGWVLGAHISSCRGRGPHRSSSSGGSSTWYYLEAGPGAAKRKTNGRAVRGSCFSLLHTWCGRRPDADRLTDVGVQLARKPVHGEWANLSSPVIKERGKKAQAVHLTHVRGRGSRTCLRARERGLSLLPPATNKGTTKSSSPVDPIERCGKGERARCSSLRSEVARHMWRSTRRFELMMEQ
ncbi:uncharacterized protein BKA78DRAFT_47245 [Phyllosticta capitalensis]|uniref:uncharacterized protein n=1 Tax=Phyllosticta capitalensis TaxID=121624 RepID=UPI00312FAAEE